MLGKFWQGAKSGISNGAAAVQINTNYNLDSSKNIDSEGLPQAPFNPYRKRPVKLTYDKNEFYMFRMPSENTFLLGSFDKEDLFGKRKGIQQSPHIKAQTDLDSNIVWLIAGVTFVMMFSELKPKHTYRTLRDNFR